jgi:hypothetical protein
MRQNRPIRNLNDVRSASRKKQRVASAPLYKMRGVMDVEHRNSFKVQQDMQFADYVGSGSVSSTPGQVNLTGLIGTLLGLSPQNSTPIYQNGGVNWRAKVHIHGIELRFVVQGSQATALLPADLYNNVRALVWESDSDSGTVAANALASFQGPLNVLDCTHVHYDSKFQLLSQAFDAGDYNVPDVKYDDYYVPINRTFDFISAVAAGTSGWTTTDKTLYYSSVSDSAVSPHPTISLTARIHFKIVRRR